MAIQDDFSVSQTGDIRHVGGATVYTVLQLHAWLQDLADNSAAAGDDSLSILQANPSRLDGPRDAAVASRLNLINGFNIDDAAARYINFGSVKQSGGDVLYSGLRSLGAIVAASPIYIVQSGAKITKFWSDGHVQAMVKSKVDGALIDGGTVRVFSRKYGQTYSHFDVDLSAGGEAPAAMATAIDTSVVLSEAQAAALSAKVSIAVGDTVQDLGNGNGGKTYKGTITLSGGATVQEAYQYLQYLCREDSAAVVAGVPGWRYVALDASYTPNSAAPFGKFAGGKWLVERGWFLAGVLPAESQSYQLTADDDTLQAPPNVIGITVGNLLAGDRVLVARDDGAGGIQTEEFSLVGAVAATDTTVTVTPAPGADTPSAGVIRIAGKRHTYSARAGAVFTLSAQAGQAYAAGTKAFVPFIDTVAAGTTESANFIYAAGFSARIKVRQGSGASPIVPFETTVSVGAAGASTNAIRTSDV